MHKTPTHEALKQRLKELEKEAVLRQQAEESLQESEEKYSTLVENSLTGIFIHQDGKYVFVNDRFAKIHGYTREELLGVEYLALIHPDERKAFAQIASARLRGEAVPQRYEVRRLRQDGKTIWCEMMATRVEYARRPAIMGNIIDISERKQMEEALRSAHDELEKRVEKRTAELAKANEKLKRQIEERKWTEKRVQVAYDQSIIYAQELKNEIKEHKRARQERKRLEAQLLQAEKMKAIGTLAGGIAHEFNNLLMGIQGHATLMMIHTDSEHPHFERLKGIEDMVQRGADLTKQLLGFARGGKYQVKLTDLNGLIEKSVQMFARTKKEIRIHRRYQKDIWLVEVDRGQIEQVLIDIYANARHAMSHGGDLYIETSNVSLDEDCTKPLSEGSGNCVKISVADTGVGMDEATRQRIFEPFFTTKEMGHGAGLGLASAYGIIKNHGGIIDVQSEKGEETTFNIYLPISGKGVTTDEAKPAKEILKGTETVLLVDDEDMVLEVGNGMLKEAGYKVLLAKSGREAVEVYRKHKDEIDLVILDMIMPDMDGGEAYDRMKDMNPEIRALLSSGYSLEGQASEILERGCNGFIQKPFGIRELSSKIVEILGKK